ncbi:MAG: NTP transferase domain-containing protein [Candidatus Eisenbacteria bacterium]|nr:NTP transferase domain-containing protein [Candidatus Eisenbacteria bacterium]
MNPADDSSVSWVKGSRAASSSSAVLLAAGASTRMGSAKALLPFPSGRSSAHPLIVDQLLRLALAGCRPIACVLGEDARAIGAEIRRHFSPLLAPRLRIVKNDAWTSGPFSSLQVGLRALGEPCPGALVLPLDVPALSPALFAALIDTGREGRAEAVVPFFHGRGGHPVWLSSATAARICSMPAEARLDDLLRSVSVSRVDVGGPTILENVNTPEDWARLLRSLEEDLERGEPEV